MWFLLLPLGVVGLKVAEAALGHVADEAFAKREGFDPKGLETLQREVVAACWEHAAIDRDGPGTMAAVSAAVNKFFVTGLR